MYWQKWQAKISCNFENKLSWLNREYVQVKNEALNALFLNFNPNSIREEGQDRPCNAKSSEKTWFILPPPHRPPHYYLGLFYLIPFRVKASNLPIFRNLSQNRSRFTSSKADVFIFFNKLVYQKFGTKTCS